MRTSVYFVDYLLVCVPFYGPYRNLPVNILTCSSDVIAMDSMLAQKLNMSYDEAELWIMNLVRNSKLDARIDSVSGTLIMTTNHVNV